MKSPEETSSQIESDQSYTRLSAGLGRRRRADRTQKLPDAAAAELVVNRTRRPSPHLKRGGVLTEDHCREKRKLMRFQRCCKVSELRVGQYDASHQAYCGA